MTQIVPYHTLNNLKDYLQLSYMVDGAETDGRISLAIGTTKRLIVVDPVVTLYSDSAAAVAVKIGFAAANLAADADAGTDGAVGILGAHKVVAGSGWHPMSGMGLTGEELRITCGTPTPGKLVITYRYKIVNA
jgi:hypothetical protein